jgi:hypothetical protein
MIKVDLSGFDKLQRELEEASEGLKSLDGEITKLVFTNFDPLDTARAIHQMEAAIDEKVGRYSQNPIIKSLTESMKEHFRQKILEESSSHRNPSVTAAASLEDSVNPVVEKKRKQRFEYMNALYEATGGRELLSVDMAEIGMALSFSKEECEATVEYLRGEGLLKHVSLGGFISITHLGVVEVETALQKPDEPTAHFPAVQNTINIHSMNNSVIQQGGSLNSQNVVLDSSDKAMIKDFLSALGKEVSGFPIGEEERQELLSDINTVSTQTDSARPRLGLVREGLKSIVGVLGKIGSSVISSEITSHLPAIHAYLSRL